jgi:hypothetical protein
MKLAMRDFTSIEHGQAALDALAAGAPAYSMPVTHHQPYRAIEGTSATHPLVVCDLHKFLAEVIPPREAILAPIILTQSLSHVALGIAYAVASGGEFLRWKALAPHKVLYLDGEMPGAALQERLAHIAKTAASEPPEGYFRLVTPDKQSGAMPDLATITGQESVDAVIDADTVLLIVDNLSALVRRGGRENDAESWLTVADWALRHRANGRSVLFIHHSGKNGAQRGTSKKEDLLDTVLTLKQPTDYNAADGAVFEVHFEKARGIYGKDTEPFEARRLTDANGAQAWAIKAVESTTYDRVIELHGLGLTPGEIAEELGIHKSSVSRSLTRAQAEGRPTKRAGGK